MKAKAVPFARHTSCVALCLLLSQLACAAPAKHPAEALVNSSEAAMRIDPELSKRNAEAALQLLQRQPDADLQVQAHLQLCDYYAERDREAAEQQLEQARALLSQVKRQGLAASVANYAGEIYEIAGDNTKAKNFYMQAVQLATTAHDDEMLAKALYSRGYILGLQGQYADGLQDLQRAQTLFEHLAMPQYALNVLNSIALLYNRLGDYAQAQHIYEQALKQQRATGMRREAAVTLHNLGRAHESQLHWDAANEAYLDALAIADDLHYTRGSAYALRGLGAVANAKGNPAGALRTLARAAALQNTTPDARLNAQIQLTRGEALHKLQRLPESAAALEQAQYIFSQAGSPTELSATDAQLANVYADMGNWRKAYEARSAAQEISSKLLRNQLDQHFATLKIEFDTAAKDKENSLLVRENAANQKALTAAGRVDSLQTLVIMLSILLALVLGALAWYQLRGKQRMSALAMTDELTQVPNRRAVMARLEEELQRAETHFCALLIIDIDHFKSINDQYGHPAGDETLKLVAVQLRTLANESGLVGRIGGEEFMLVLPGASLEAAMQLAERFRVIITELEFSRWLANRTITVSIGVTVSMPGADTSSSMLHRADVALYAAKRAGRNCVRCEPEVM